MNAVLNLASEATYLLGGHALWETEAVGFHINFTPGITNWMPVFWGIMLFMIVAGAIGARKKALVPSGWQNFCEWAYGGLTNFFTKIMGPHLAKTFAPLLVTFFIFILLSNYSGTLPLAGLFPALFHGEEIALSNLQAPTSVLSVTIGFALIVFFSVHYAGFRERKLGYFRKLISPMPLMLPFAILDEILHPVTLAMRLYGNIHGEETVVHELFGLTAAAPWAPGVMEILGMLFGLIQALVFSLLAAIYISEAAEHEE
ncbi:MAG: F0F1 ATP synthase subunit A [Firmicutes bacterium]|nr:F0F1 ATP synthase subunit A [Bacillota bacterium]